MNNGICKGTRAEAYKIALEKANASGETPGLDGWWAVLKAAEAEAIAMLVAEAEAMVEADARRAEYEARESIDLRAETDTLSASGGKLVWGSYRRDFGRWSRAHAFVLYLDERGNVDEDRSSRSVCGTGPGSDEFVEWANEVDAGEKRCRCCLRRLGMDAK